MRKKRNSKQLSIIMFNILMVFGVFCCGGTFYTVLKNKQIHLARQIETVQSRTDQHGMDIRTEQMRVDQLLDRYMIRERLRVTGSQLQPISQDAIVHIATPLSDDLDHVVVNSQ